MIIGWIIAGIVTVLAFIALLVKMDAQLMRRILGYDIYFDLGISAFMCFILAGTFSGMMAGLMAGLTLSILLIPTKALIGYEKYQRVRCNSCKHSHYEWVRYPGKLHLVQTD